MTASTASAPPVPPAGLRGFIRGHVHRLVGNGAPVAAARAPDDPGLFGPGSAAWAVHGDFPAMMVGGVSALLLQMLHPGALAGVWDHSDFRGDMPGRLKRTAGFIAGTTFGGTAHATALIDRVRRVHDHVSGMLPDGTPYSANAPDLLTWVHVAETDSFLRAHLRYRDPNFPARDQDRYLQEMTVLARRLGAGRVPASRREIAAYYREVQPALRFDDRTRAVADALFTQARRDSIAGTTLMDAAVDLLPPWAQQLHGRQVSALRRPAIRAAVRGGGQVLRWALRPAR
ncbi:uncharacterized protein (DUF2236 family) [Sphingomonas jejuensis]|uniref:Uncharacterized protein (DUF2236 family) n=1 Tax=Sphingomonas jejuensis TaxID=904715 RepID=A0ABX0XNW6_9SPHN|nr:oxygenase MpaB family protein [Sphingomonas jejuensis]NJC34427.1 uncharacterized protein (DUF2236 family) [Sphingomonas jejuensis]